MPFSGMRLSVSLYLQVRECWMVGWTAETWSVLGLDHVSCVWLLILCFILGSFAGREFRFCDSCTGGGPARWSWRTPYTAYAGSSGLAFAGVGVANWGSRPANEPGDETWNWQLHTPHMVQFERVSRLGGLLVIWHFLTCKYFDYFLRKMGAPPTTPLQSAAVAVHRPCWNGWKRKKIAQQQRENSRSWLVNTSLRERARVFESLLRERTSLWYREVNCGNIFSLLKS